MRMKLFEVRDRSTCIPCLAISMTPGDALEQAFLARGGFAGGDAVLLVKLADREVAADPYDWAGCRTMTAAHLLIEAEFAALPNGAVVDVRVVHREADRPAEPEIWRDSA